MGDGSRTGPDDWPDTTYEGVQLAQRRRALALTPEQRLRWVEELVRDAERSGVLAQVRLRRQQAATAAWERTG